ncbi:MAG: SpoIIE family protein phosphatase [Bryobacteraceae bacterium]
MWRALALLCLIVLGAAAQTIVNAESGPWAATLDGTWRWHSGDDRRWASPAFDDSGWPALRVPGPVPNSRAYWIRLSVALGPTTDPASMLGPIAYMNEVYWDGEHIGDFGNFSRKQWFVPRWHTFQLPPASSKPGSHTVAIRIGEISTGLRNGRQPRLNAGENRIGDLAALREAESAYMRTDFQSRLLQLLLTFGFILAGLYFILLPPLVAQGAAFRWLGLILLAGSLGIIPQFYLNYGPLDMPDLARSLLWTCVSVFLIGLLRFPHALFRRRVPIAIRYFECFLALLASPVPFPYSARVLRSASVLAAALVPVALARAELRKRTADAKLILVLFAFLAAAIVHDMLAVILHSPTGIYIFGSRVVPLDLVFLLWVPAISRQVHKANLRFRDERERLRGEMEAARHVHEVLVSAHSVQVRGFDIDASYRPATEIGGDFFQSFPGSGDALFVVVGDASGKGMKAALLVSVIVGALRNRKSDQPLEVLGQLNAVLLDQSEGGFTTCCCALFVPDGTLAIANAGHLAHYRNGREIETAPGLPLGVVRDASWEETRIELQPNDRVLWMSDGVVEARNGERDLLGFQRAEELATRSASEIAQAAQQFGQDDDITVVSITRQPVPGLASHCSPA